MPDLNGNGISEIVVAYYDTGQTSVVVEVFYDGALNSQVIPFAALPVGVAGLDAGDMDGDGDIDLIVTLQSTGAAPAQAIPYGNVGGMVQAVGVFPLLGLAAAERVHDTQLADLNADGSATLLLAMAAAGGDLIEMHNYVQTPSFVGFLPAGFPLLAAGQGGAGAPSSLGTPARARITVGDVSGSIDPRFRDVTLCTGPVGGASAGVQMFINAAGTFPAAPIGFAGAPYDAVTDVQSASLDALMPGDMVFADPLAGIAAFQVGVGGTGIVGPAPPTSLALNAAGATGVAGATNDIVATNFVRFLGTGPVPPQDVFMCDSVGRITGLFNDQAPPPPLGAPATFNIQAGYTPILTLPGAPFLNSISAGNLDGNNLTDFATCSRGGNLWRIAF